VGVCRAKSGYAGKTNFPTARRGRGLLDRSAARRARDLPPWQHHGRKPGTVTAVIHGRWNETNHQLGHALRMCKNLFSFVACPQLRNNDGSAEFPQLYVLHLAGLRPLPSPPESSNRRFNTAALFKYGNVGYVNQEARPAAANGHVDGAQLAFAYQGDDRAGLLAPCRREFRR
jgi:hypothetical protein